MDIVLYSTGCPKCRILESKLNQNGIKYNLVDNEDVMIEKGFMSAPMLEIDGNVMNFTEAMKWVIDNE